MSEIILKLPNAKIPKLNIEPPKGYRLLNSGEVVKKGDVFYRPLLWRYNQNHWTSVSGFGYIGANFNPNKHRIIARKIIPKINYSETEKNNIINKLKRCRAFNEDSAIKIGEKNKEFLLFYSLLEDKVIGAVEDRFYLKNYEPK